jgi:hypothetical protein
MTNAASPAPKWPFWASIIALVFALLGLCTGYVFPWGSLLCPVIAVVLAIIGLKSRRKALAIAALVISVLSFCVVAGVGAFLWTSPDYQANLGGLGNSLGNLFQSMVNLIKAALKIP